MSSLPKFILSLTFLLLLTHYSTAKKISKVRHFVDKDLFAEVHNIDNNVLTYGICDDSEEVRNKSCTVFHETFGFDGSVRTKSCDFDIVTGHSSKVFGEVHVVYPFGSDRTILVSYEEDGLENNDAVDYHLIFTVVNFDGCKVDEGKVKLDSSKLDPLSVYTHFNLISTDEKFDVFYYNHKICGKSTCKATFDAKANIIEEPKAWIDSTDEAILELEQAKYPGSYVGAHFDRKDDITHVEVFTYDKEYHLLREFDDVKEVKFSGANGKVGFCAQLNYTAFNCSQIDFQPKILNFKHKVEKSYLYNLPGRGFLFAVANCKNEHCYKKKSHFDVWKITDDSSTRLTIKGLNCKTDENFVELKLLENNENEYCLSRVCHKGGADAILQYDVECFGLNDFHAA